jgi:hypothetical protein
MNNKQYKMRGMNITVDIAFVFFSVYHKVISVKLSPCFLRNIFNFILKSTYIFFSGQQVGIICK